MDFFDRLFGKPTLQGLTGKVTRGLRKRGALDISANLELAEVTATIDGGPVRIYLGNVLADYRRSPRSQRAAVLQKFLTSLAPQEDAVPPRYEDAKPRLMPVVRSIADIGVATLSAARLPPGAKPFSSPVHRPLVADMVVALVCDSTTSMAYVTEEQVAQWQVDFQQALDQAIHNLRGLPEAGGWKELAPGVWSGEWGDAYEASRILTPDLIHRLGVPEPVALVPFRNALLVTSERNPAGLQLMLQVAQTSLEDNQRWLSFEPIRLAGDRWTAHDPAGESCELLRVLRGRNNAATYSTQKQLLDDLHQTSGTDIFVASYQLMQRDDEAPRSYTVWTEGVDTLLPPAELIALVQPEGNNAKHVLVSWEDALAFAGDLLEPSDLVPIRYRARRFPAPHVLERLRERAVR
ncbi:hypothetical protein HLB44_36035 [Aquincola sp. S2]|uniref:DUF1444 domain-containing protein n=1 Tax=Pseudaquabacterium terrae TaxID=2732868 RepID=A0ABX2EVC2_9BURK|nr:hypothetical protein [Aquabacterium terrae]NRF72401.1 hypothetical protein [Aquabacterium terrae]